MAFFGIYVKFLGYNCWARKSQWYCWCFRNPATVEVGSLSHYLEGFIHSRWWSPDFFHQQYWETVLQKRDDVFCLVGSYMASEERTFGHLKSTVPWTTVQQQRPTTTVQQQEQEEEKEEKEARRTRTIIIRRRTTTITSNIIMIKRKLTTKNIKNTNNDLCFLTRLWVAFRTQDLDTIC